MKDGTYLTTIGGLAFLISVGWLIGAAMSGVFAVETPGGFPTTWQVLPCVALVASLIVIVVGGVSWRRESRSA